MQQQSLGLIEARGLATGIEAADAAMKSANVTLVGYEFAKGGGWTTIKVVGDVGAVKAAVAAAKVAAEKVNGVVSAHVIARPSSELVKMICNNDTVGYTAPVAVPAKTKVEEVASPVAEVQAEASTEEQAEESETIITPEAVSEAVPQPVEESPVQAEEIAQPDAISTEDAMQPEVPEETETGAGAVEEAPEMEQPTPQAPTVKASPVSAEPKQPAARRSNRRPQKRRNINNPNSTNNSNKPNE